MFWEGEFNSPSFFVGTRFFPLRTFRIPMALAPVTRARLQATLAAAAAGLLWSRTRHPGPAVLAGVLSTLALVAWLAPARYAPVQRVLDRLLQLLLGGLTWLVLGLVYFGFFTPLRICGALLRRDPLRLRPAPAATSYLQPLSPDATRRFDRQF